VRGRARRLAGGGFRAADLVVRLAIDVAIHLRGLLARSYVTSACCRLGGILARHRTTSQPKHGIG